MQLYNNLINIRLFLSMSYLIVAVILFLIESIVANYFLFFAFIPISIILHRYIEVLGFIDVKIYSAMDEDIKQFEIFSHTYPGYKFVDLFQALESFTNHFTDVVKIDSQHDEALNAIIQRLFFTDENRKIKSSYRMSLFTDAEQEKFFSTERYWIVNASRKDGKVYNLILRFKLIEHQDQVRLEMAADSVDAADEVLEYIKHEMKERSIYKNKAIEVSFEAGVKDEYGYVEAGEKINIKIKKEFGVGEERIVMDPEIKKTLQRNIIDFQQQRAILKKFNIPSKKGILFYGPPGTGKTYTCKYIHHAIKSITTIVVTGQNLLHVKSICNIAKMLQPSLLILEDVDLIFTNRETNLYSTVLGDLMDELDGFQFDEEIIFILTTNAIDRVEKAIKDRPGRISQCIFFDTPNSKLREEYIQQYSASYDCSKLDLRKLVEKTKGASQAFIKEMIYRAVQINLEKQQFNSDIVMIEDSDFEMAYDEMVNHSEKMGHAIIGFKVQ